MTRNELLEEKEALQKAKINILEGGQEFQTRDGRVKMASLETISAQLAEVNAMLAQMDAVNGATTDTVKLRFVGVGEWE